MSGSALIGYSVVAGITLYCLVWLWRLPAALGEKLLWTLVCVLFPGIGTLLLLELYVPVAPEARPGSGSGPHQSAFKLPPGLVAGFLSICALLHGGMWAVLGAVALLTGHTDAWLSFLGGLSLLAFGGYFLKRGSQQLAASSARAAA